MAEREQKVLIEGANSDTWGQNHFTFITASLPDSCDQLLIEGYIFDRIGNIKTGLVISEAPSRHVQARIKDVLHTSRQQISRPRWIVSTSGDLFFDRELLEEVSVSGVGHGSTEIVNRGLRILNRINALTQVGNIEMVKRLITSPHP